METLVEDIFQRVNSKAKDALLKWNTDGSVRVLIGKIIPDGPENKQDLFERRKRFREALTKRLGVIGYTEQGYGRYSPESAKDSGQETTER